MIPAMIWGIYMFGLDAVRVGLISVLSCLAIEFLIQKYIMNVKPSITDGSALITGVLLAFNVPASLPWWIIIIGAIAAMGVGKLSFGGLGSNVFNPALVGRVFLLISFPVQMTSWPAIRTAGIDAVSAATPLAVIKEGIKNGIPVSQLKGLPDLSDMAIGLNPGSLGEISAILLIIGGLYMLWKKSDYLANAGIDYTHCFGCFGYFLDGKSRDVCKSGLPYFYGRFNVGSHIYGNRYGNFSNDRKRTIDLRYWNWVDHHLHSYVWRLSRRYFVRNSDYECVCAADQYVY